MEAGEEVTDTEWRALLHELFASLARVLDTDSVKALVDRIEAGEQVDDDEARETLRDAIAAKMEETH